MFSIRQAAIENRPIIHSLIQPYLTELSVFPDEDPDYRDESGVYHYAYLDAYWREPQRFPYLLYADEAVAGLALVRDAGEYWEMAEYYVKPEFRRLGLAEFAAGDIFLKHPGQWRIEFNKHNEPSRRLWNKLANRLARGKVEKGESDASHDFVRFWT